MGEHFASLQPCPKDAIMEAFTLCTEDPIRQKFDLTIGAYRYMGSPHVFAAVREAEKELLSTNHEYLPMGGLPNLYTLVGQLLFGQSLLAEIEARTAGIQTLSGTGALNLFFQLLAKDLSLKKDAEKPVVWVSSPTWPVHSLLAREMNFQVKEYPYYAGLGLPLNFDGMKNSLLEFANDGDVLILHTCGHNPTGVDLTVEQWDEILVVANEKKLCLFFDSAYLGFISGDVTTDVRPIVKAMIRCPNLQIGIGVSFAKNMGLYGERIGYLFIINGLSSDLAEDDYERHKLVIKSNLERIARITYSNPPKHGALILERILSNTALREKWLSELKTIAKDIADKRYYLFDALDSNPSTSKMRDWSFIKTERGLFSFCFTPQEAMALRKEHVYLVASGRISVAGVNRSNVDYIVDAVAKVAEEFGS